jgi:biopolymer transport protein ExbD
MAEINIPSANKNKGGKRMNKKSTRVDLTAMVDLGFLLLTFFVFTTTISKPSVMNIITPKESPEFTPVCETCAITAILAAGNKIFYYEGMQQNNIILKQTTFNADGLRALFLKKKETVKQLKGNADDMVLIVKPTNESSYKNFVDILDEVAITGVKHYFIDELNAGEKKMLLKNL